MDGEERHFFMAAAIYRNQREPVLITVDQNEEQAVMRTLEGAQATIREIYHSVAPDYVGEDYLDHIYIVSIDLPMSMFGTYFKRLDGRMLQVSLAHDVAWSRN